LRIRHLWLNDFRSYDAVDLELAGGLTVILGANGQGKTNQLEAIGYLATLSSFRGAPLEAMIRDGVSAAVVRAEGEREGRELLIEAELVANGRNRVQINRQRLQRSRDLLGAVRVSVFSPDDLSLVKGGPGERRRYLDDTLVALHARYDQVRADVERVLRQRNALLKQSAGGNRFDESAAFTLDVWDAKLTEAGEALATARRELVERMEPEIADAYRSLAPSAADVAIVARYECAWADTGLAAALASARRDDLRRGVTTVGPHRDELHLALAGLPARTHASQGEQRSLALALRLAAHRVVAADTGTAPVLLLDDVFSELDPTRSDSLLHHLPPGQTVLTSAAGLPVGATPELVVRLENGAIEPA
jgi:DNA replication and repair protein RecF